MGIGVSAKLIDDRTVQINFKKGSPTFDLEMSPLVFPLYVTSKAYHSDGDMSQEAFDRFRANPLAAGPYQVVARQAQRFVTLEAARKDPLLGCPVYDRIEIRSVPETGTRMSQFRTGQQDIISGSRDLVDQAKKRWRERRRRPDTNMIGLYIFQTDRKEQRLPQRGRAQGRRLRHRPQAAGRDDLGRCRHQAVGLHLAALDRDIGAQSALPESLPDALPLRSGQGEEPPDRRRLCAGARARPSSSNTR